MGRLAPYCLWLARLVAAAILVWFCGFAWFVSSSYLMPADPSSMTDAIVVLTGGRQRLGPLPENAACCIVIGHTADNTFGNARETADWMHEEGYRSLRLVTGWYHMRRSLLEFERAMPRVRIVPHPVFAHRLDPERWWSWHGAPLLVLGEYDKFLVSWARPVLGAFWPMPVLAPVRTAELPGAVAGAAP